MQFKKSLLFLCLCLLTCYRGFTQDIAEALHGGDSKTWELRQITWVDGEEEESEEFGEDEEYIEEHDEATLIPETITFHADGTCELLYIAFFSETDSDEDEDLVVEARIVEGYWEVVGQDVKIMEPAEEGEDDEGLDPGEGYAWWLKNIQIGDDEFECGFEYYGFTDGIQSIEFDLEQ
ncbi:MAG: hypothetical protein DYG98_10055 [Haliscomenobacteraceae bacterium CHB4]|nr:hypothetical protein [Haliscomenobacteraceae bacterium CHB4]